MIYKFRVLSDEDELFLRDFEVDSESTFLTLHKAIQENLGFDPSQLVSFFLADEHWNKGMELTLIDMQNDTGLAAIPMDKVKIKELITKRKERLLYTYDIFADRNLFIELIDIAEAKEGIEYPLCTASLGEAPIQVADDIILDFDAENDEKNEIDELFDEFNDEDFGNLGYDDDSEF
ncbi:MAG: hypothetical protein PWR03_1763 [Tenuifilum sp.]|jgi:hypothetical protein|uniref:IS1096 element passenger TnpR family protein n=1 Tax=Tenuifilum sp. TaxID=2760880 RepID=UPI0024AB1A83|nr:hypothetical protein [Tenuifilum sp.]MDI3527580.1 hypothetical protein [Tenuifilum sp.]